MKPEQAPPDVDVLIVGAGFGGLYMLHRARELGFTVRAIEAADGVGGTWYWNRYPGARCDIESLQYSYSFLPELDQQWQWSERYASQPEILRYLNHVADRLRLRADITLCTRVTAATFDANSHQWAIETDRNECISARFFILAPGCLSVPRRPDIPGIDRFTGRLLQTSRWPHEPVSFDGERVGVVGTGSSAIQSIPVIAAQARHLFVFQRTPSFSVPAHNGPVDPQYQKWFMDNIGTLRLQARRGFSGTVTDSTQEPQPALAVDASARTQRYERAWQRGGLEFMSTFSDLFFDAQANATAVEFLHGKIRSTVADPEVAELLTPRTYPAFTKRLCVDTGYFQTFNRPNVTLVDLQANPLEEVTAAGIKTREAEYRLDTIVFATGFDAMTGALLAIEIRGRDAIQLRDRWAAGPRTYLGVAVCGFPNMFIVAGPGSPSVLTNMVVSIEQHVEWIAECLSFLRAHQLRSIEASEAAEAQWIDHVSAVAAGTLFPLAPSWYIGANIPGKPRVFMAYFGGAGGYRAKCDDVARMRYEGFIVSGDGHAES